MFLWNSLVFFYDPTDVDNLISGSSASLKPSLYIWKFSIHVLLKLSLKDFEHNLNSIWDFPGGSNGKASTYNAGDLGSIPGSGRSPGEGNGNLL